MGDAVSCVGLVRGGPPPPGARSSAGLATVLLPPSAATVGKPRREWSLPSDTERDRTDMSDVLTPLSTNCAFARRPSPPSGSPPDSVPRRLRRVQSENAFALPTRSPRRARMVVLPSNAFLPNEPMNSPVKNSPKTVALRTYRRERLLKSSSLAKISIMAEKPKPPAAMPRSRSASSLGGHGASGLTSSPSLLPTNFVRRARSTPMLRGGASSATPDKLQSSVLRREPRLPNHVGSLGASLRFPLGPEMMLKTITMPPAFPVSVPAAKLFVDTTTGKSIHLRCS